MGVQKWEIGEIQAFCRRENPHQRSEEGEQKPGQEEEWEHQVYGGVGETGGLALTNTDTRAHTHTSTTAAAAFSVCQVEGK